MAKGYKLVIVTHTHTHTHTHTDTLLHGIHNCMTTGPSEQNSD